MDKLIQLLLIASEAARDDEIVHRCDI